MSNSIDKIHADNLQILDEFVRIAKQNNLEFFLIGGTALGAVRHKGYIPWDDDIDIGMKREDFDKFCEIVDQYLNSKEFFVNHNEYEFPFIKIYLKNTVIESDEYFTNNRPEFIDIFPFDPINKDAKLRLKRTIFRLLRPLIYIKVLSMNHILELYSSKVSEKFRYLIVPLIVSIKCILFLVPLKILIYLRSKIMYKQYEYNDIWINWGSPYKIGKEAVVNPDNLILIPFEHRLLPVFAEYSNYLTRMYGEFMVLPPETERQGHHVKQNR